jgi:hypothetical protein
LGVESRGNAAVRQASFFLVKTSTPGYCAWVEPADDQSDRRVRFADACKEAHMSSRPFMKTVR